MPKKRFSAIILDHSGTISNDFVVFICAMNKALAATGAQAITPEEIRTSTTPTFGDFFAKKGVTDYPALQRMYRDFLEAGDLPTPIPGAIEAVKALAKTVVVGVLSAHPHELVLQDLERYGLLGRVIKPEFVMGGERKAYRVGIETLITRMDVLRESILGVGDTVGDFELANKVGIASALVLHPGYGYADREVVAQLSVQPSHGVHQDLASVAEMVRRSFLYKIT